MYTKASIYNLALGALLLQRQVVDPATDASNECKVLNTHYDTAFRITIENLNLDSMKTQAPLEVLTTDDVAYPNWTYIYKYPANCAFFRRIKTSALQDNRYTREPLQIAMWGSPQQKVIMCNLDQAYGEFLAYDIPLSSLAASAGLAVAYRLAMLSAPLATGKGAQKLIQDIAQKYVIAKAEAQEQDRMENFNFDEPEVVSEFVAERLS